jgi:hypothetical protein
VQTTAKVHAWLQQHNTVKDFAELKKTTVYPFRLSAWRSVLKI